MHCEQNTEFLKDKAGGT